MPVTSRRPAGGTVDQTPGILPNRYKKLLRLPTHFTWPKGRHPVAIFRHTHGITQQQFAREMGVTAQYLSFLETSRRSMPVHLALFFERRTKGIVKAVDLSPLIFEARRGWTQDIPPGRLTDEIMEEYE